MFVVLKLEILISSRAKGKRETNFSFTMITRASFDMASILAIEKAFVLSTYWANTIIHLLNGQSWWSGDLTLRKSRQFWAAHPTLIINLLI